MCVIIIHFLPIINDGGAPRDSLSWYNEAPEGGHLRRSEGLQLSDGRGSVMRLRKLYDQWRQQRYRSSLLVSFHFIYPGSRVVWGCLPRSRIYNTTTRRPMREREREEKNYILRKAARSHVFYCWLSATPSHFYMVRPTLFTELALYILFLPAMSIKWIGWLDFLSLKEYWRLRRVSHELSRLRWLSCIRQV